MLSFQFCIALAIPDKKLGRLVPKRLNPGKMPSRFDLTIETLSASFGWRAWPGGKPARLIANVGQRGSGESNSMSGKLLEMPPSENQQCSSFGSGGG